MQQLTTHFAQPAAVERDFDVGQLPAILWRRKWIIVTAVVVGLLLARVVIERLEPVYTANTQLIISPEQPVLDVQSVAAALRGDDQSTASEVYVLRSHDLAERVVDALNLVADHEHHGFAHPEIVLEVMQDAPGIAHTGAGHDHAGSAFVIERLRLFHRLAGDQSRKVAAQLA